MKSTSPFFFFEVYKYKYQLSYFEAVTDTLTADKNHRVKNRKNRIHV